ncbi:hypothetical protein [Sulfobacillus thermotolerans]|uniref:hypothetical protein n=1 Tax=Sulfobacillus thermotolerans TaxID=338644 RepID=UPI0033680A45
MSHHVNQPTPTRAAKASNKRAKWRVRPGRRRRLMALLLVIIAVLAGALWWLFDPSRALNTARVSALNKGYALGQQRVTILMLGNALSIINGKDVTNPHVRDRTDAMMIITTRKIRSSISRETTPLRNPSLAC